MEVGVIGGAVSTPAYPGASDRASRALALPFLIYRGKVFRADQSGIGAQLVKRERVEFDIGLAASLPARSDDVAARAGMPDLGTLLEFGPRVKINLAQLGEGSRVRLDLPLRAVLEVRDGLRGQGYTFEPKVVIERRGPGARWTMDAQAGFVWGDRTVNRYFYEVAPAFATPLRQEYRADSGPMLARVGASGSRVFGGLRGDDVRVFGFVRYDSYANAANRASPLLQKSSGVSAGIGLAWTLFRSAATEER